MRPNCSNYGKDLKGEMAIKSDFPTVTSTDCSESLNKCIGKIIWENGAIYEGEIQNGQIGEKGALKMPSQFSYIGYFKNGLPHGNGKMYFHTSVRNV